MNPIEEQPSPTIAETDLPPAEESPTESFNLVEVATVAAAHGAHDTYFSFLPTILPLLIQNLSLNTTQAGLLSAFSQFPNLLQPLIGHLADRKNLKALVIMAPTLSGILITLVGVAPNYGTAALLMLLAGFSTACFHSISPGMATAQAGRKVGRGMGFFMVGGEFGFAVGPLLVVTTIAYLTIRGLPWLMTLGMLASIILFFRLKNVSTVRHAQAEAGLPVREALLQMKGLMLPIIAIIFITGFLMANVVSYLPTFMSREGVSFTLAGASLSVVEVGATAGVLLMGLVSDRLGHRNVALYSTLASAAFSVGFLLTSGWLQMILLVGVGISAFMANPAFLALIQTRFPTNRALSTGVYMSSSFILRSTVVVIVGMLADRFGLRHVFWGSALATLVSIPFFFFLPKD
jgi:MFS transporter, FSR family, fosmidomycin resistance protein